MNTRVAIALCAGLLISLWALDAPAPNRRAHDHIGAYNFHVEIDGKSGGYFLAQGGLGIDVGVVSYQDGSDLKLERKRPGQVKYKKITLKKGYIINLELQSWWERVVKHSAYDSKAIKLSIVQRKKDGTLKPRCTFNLAGTKLTAMRKRKAKFNKTIVTYEEVDLVPTRVTHNCAKMFKHPSKR